MKPRITVITIGVDDLERAVRCHRGGLLRAGVRTDWAWLSGRAPASRTTRLSVGPVTPTAFTIGHNVASRAEVDALMAQAEAAGATS